MITRAETYIHQVAMCVERAPIPLHSDLPYSTSYLVRTEGDFKSRAWLLSKEQMIQADVQMCLEDLRLMWDESSVRSVSYVLLSGTACSHITFRNVCSANLKIVSFLFK